MSELKFRYSRGFIFCLMYVGGIPVCLLLFIALFRAFLAFAGINFEVNNINASDTTTQMLLLVGGIVIIVAAFIVPFKHALKVTDNVGTALFEAEGIQLIFEHKTINVAYTDIQEIEYRKLKIAGVPLHAAKIKTRQGDCAITGSYKEAWQHKGTTQYPEILNIVTEIAQRTGLELKRRNV